VKIKIVVLIFALTLAICGCENISKTRYNPDDMVSKDPPSQNANDILKDRIYKMALDEKVGQLVMVGLEGYAMNDFSQEMIEKYKVGGFILFKRNIEDSDQTLDLINSLKAVNLQNTVPLFFAVDEEGGNVSRMPDGFRKLPTNRVIGKIDSEEFSFEVGKILGEQIQSLGFNMNLAPVLDIDSNPQNPVIGNRSFGPDARIVGKLGAQTMKGIQTRVISVVKHFPGHGDTSVDSHIGLPRVSHDVDRLKDFELVPFKEAIENGADAVMIGHILLPHIDPESPATFSKALISNILREEMEFDGVIITDDMTMGAIVENYDIGDAAVKAVLAGADIVLVCHDNEKQVAVIEALKSAVAEGTITETILDEHLYRILKLKQKYKITDEQTTPAEVEKINDKIREVMDEYL
jgi:beta-N-acetylhexosaminidase